MKRALPIVLILFAALGLAAAAFVFLREQTPPTKKAACGFERSTTATNKLVVHARGRRNDILPDIIFDDGEYDKPLRTQPDYLTMDGRERINPRLVQPSYLPIEIPAGPSLELVVSANENVLVALTGATERVSSITAIRTSPSVHVGFTGQRTKKISFVVKPDCVELADAPPEHHAKDAPASSNVETKRFDWRNRAPQMPWAIREVTPIRWPRDIRLPQLVAVDVKDIVASGPAVKPAVLPGWAGYTRLLEQGKLRRPLPREAEAALDQVRRKYVSRFKPEWRPQFRIDFVMTERAPLPRPDDDFQQTMVLALPSVAIDRQEENCIVALGPVAPRSSDEPGLSKLRQPPPYVIAASTSQKCLGGDANIGPPLFEMADRVSAEPVPECRAVEPQAGDVIVVLHDGRGARGGRTREGDPVANVRLEGQSRVVLIAYGGVGRRSWKIQEAFKGQVTAFLLTENYLKWWQPLIEGLEPEQIVLDEPRLTRWREIISPEDPLQKIPYRSARLNSCEKAPLADSHASRTSVSERGFDNSVKVWTGRPIDILQDVRSEKPVTIDVDRR